MFAQTRPSEFLGACCTAVLPCLHKLCALALPRVENISALAFENYSEGCVACHRFACYAPTSIATVSLVPVSLATCGAVRVVLFSCGPLDSSRFVTVAEEMAW